MDLVSGIGKTQELAVGGGQVTLGLGHPEVSSLFPEV